MLCEECEYKVVYVDADKDMVDFWLVGHVLKLHAEMC